MCEQQESKMKTPADRFREKIEATAWHKCEDCSDQGRRVPTSDGGDLWLCEFHYDDLLSKMAAVAE